MAKMCTEDASNVTLQQLLDADLNGFALVCLVESYAPGDRRTLPPPVDFVVRGVRVRLAPIEAADILPKSLSDTIREQQEQITRLTAEREELLTACGAADIVMTRLNQLSGVGQVRLSDDDLAALQRAVVICKQTIDRCEAAPGENPNGP